MVIDVQPSCSAHFTTSTNEKEDADKDSSGNPEDGSNSSNDSVGSEQQIENSAGSEKRTKEEAVSSLSSHSSTKNTAEPNLDKFTALYEKYNSQCNELERLEKANYDIKEQLQKIKWERDNAQEMEFRDFLSQREGLERRLLDVELQLKMAIQRAQARELHYEQSMKQSEGKWSQKLEQALKKSEAAEKGKNDAVCRYAAREAELMRLQAKLEQIEEQDHGFLQNNMLSMEKEALKKSTEFECLENLKHSLEEAENQLKLEKEASKGREEDYKMTAKHLEASQTVLTELRSCLESVQSQLAQEQVEKRNYEEELKKTQTVEQKLVDEISAGLKKTNDQEELYKHVCNELSSLRSRNAILSQELDHVVHANAELQTESQRLCQELTQTRHAHQVALEKLESLEQVRQQLNSSLHRIELAEKAAAEAVTERNQAEEEAAECRKQAERMLEITEQLTDKNCSLTSQQEILKIKDLELNHQIKSLETAVSGYEKRVTVLNEELELLKVDSTAEIETLRQQIDSNVAENQQLNAFIVELRNEREILKKKNASSIKELRAEVQYLRKLQYRSTPSSNISVDDNLSPAVLSSGALGPSTSSQASSVASFSDLCPLVTDHNASSTATGQQKESQQTSVLQSVDDTSCVQQQMVEKIVKLQRQLARRQDKIEFLEEHVRQCTQELLKKSKIIQNYALREEAALLLPETDLNKRHNGTNNASLSLLGNLFTTSVGRKSELELTAEVNSRLQAVLEDVLHKNITLKQNIDTLSEEISRLSRENRQLLLSKVT
ncbi:unnamed protein product [Thelazia callipaeda]|uniref:Megator n=1 Tax=Thelazia callipaeda TaxID=103827 RepID=A0A0N5CKH7_THECL|nr:unnamed protein product [Thelazia callipaeda]